MSIQVRARKWGSSLGIVIPKEFVEREGIKENDDIEIFAVKRKTIGHLYGALKGLNIDAQAFKDEFRQEEREAERRKRRDVLR